MQRIVDFHTHAFPDEIAGRAMHILLEEGKQKYDVQAYLDGTVSSLLDSMDRNNIEKSVVCSIATKPSQFDPILKWSEKIRTDRIIPFPSLHPDDPMAAQHIAEIRERGFKGVKFHPYYQKFSLDEERLFPLYEELSGTGLIVLMHTGFDLAFERTKIADPQRIIRVLERFPDLNLVTTHLGAWEDWNDVEQMMVGKKIYMEISFALDILEKEKARRIIMNHPKEYVLFGTDSPWTDQGSTIALLRGLELGHEIERMILRNNALNLLNSV